MKKLAVLLALFFVSPALGQVRQSGTVTPRHATCWATTGVIQDCGTAAAPFASSFGTVGSGPTICAYSDLLTATGYQRLCLGATTAGGGQISVQNFGTALALPLSFNVNGVAVSFISGQAPFTATGIPCFLDSTGVLIDCGLKATSGTITTGVWNGTPVDVAHGGTGANNASSARTNLGLGTMAVQDASAVNITGAAQITGLPSPSVSSDAATKGYVDATATGLLIKVPVVLATVAVLPQTPTYSNGASGVGATLTAASNAAIVIDGVTPSAAQRVLVKTQAAPAQNGCYTVTTVGDGSNAWVLTRCTDFDTAAEMLAGSYFFVTAGSVNANGAFVLSATVTTVGSTAANFYQFSGTGSSVTSLNSLTGGLTLTGNTGLTVSASVSTVALGTSGGIDTNVLNSQTADYTIASTDCGKTIQAGTGSTGLFTLTLPSVSGFGTTCSVAIKNGDTGRGKVLSGFPADFAAGSGILWPLQSGSVKIVNGAWVTGINPGPYQATGSVTLQVNHSTGSDSTADCLGTGAGACSTILHAYKLFQTAVKAGPGGTSSIQSDCNFTESPGTAFLGRSLSSDGVVYVFGNTGTPSSCTWTSAGIVVDDGAVLSLNGFKTINASTGQTWLTSTKMGLALFTNMIWGSAASGAHMGISDGGVIVYESAGTYQVGAGGDACLPTCFNYHIINNGGTFELSGATISVPAALTFNTWYTGSGSGSNSNWGTVTFTGTGRAGGSVGQPYNLGYNAVLKLNGATTDFPGSTAASVKLGGCTDNVCVPGDQTLFASVSGVCGAVTKGAITYIADSNTVVWGAIIAGGGGNGVLGFCNGSNWTVAGK